ncbi:hypothetical protein ACOSQ3_028903 [Xanthoceras sorbifolium]
MPWTMALVHDKNEGEIFLTCGNLGRFLVFMAGVFMFSAQSTPVSMKEKPPDLLLSSKKARTDNEDVSQTMRMQPWESFKTKLLSMASSGSWTGFGSGMVAKAMVDMVMVVVRMAILRKELKLKILALLVGKLVNEKKKSHQSSSNHNEVGVFSNFSIEDRGIASRKGKMQANISVPVVQSNVLDDKLDDADVLK